MRAAGRELPTARQARGEIVVSERCAITRLPQRIFGADLWLVDLSVTAASSDCLSPAEQARAARFVFAVDRRRYVAAHVALRSLLGEFCGLAAADVRLILGPNDKPSVAGRPDCTFNMSHSGERALIAITRPVQPGDEIGVDLEELRGLTDIDALAAANFTAAEQAELAVAAAGDRERLFLSGWTRKEACLKAIGSGLTIAPSTFDCALAPGRTDVRMSTPAGAAVIAVESIEIGPGHLAAIAITTPVSQDRA